MCQEYIMWGAGSYGRRLVEMTARESEYRIIAYCDRNMELSGKTLDGHKIISIETAAEMCRENSELGVIIGVFDYDVVAGIR